MENAPGFESVTKYMSGSLFCVWIVENVNGMLVDILLTFFVSSACYRSASREPMVRVNHSGKCNALVRAADNIVLIRSEMFACSSYHDFR